MAEVADAAPSLGEKPLIILSAGARQYPGFTKGQAKRYDEQFTEFEAGLTGLSQDSKLVVAKNSAHYIQFDRPELVVDAIRQVVDAARDSGRVCSRRSLPSRSLESAPPPARTIPSLEDVGGRLGQ